MDPPASDAPALRAKLVDAKAFAESVVFTDAFATCVEQSITIDNGGWTAEHIVRKSSASRTSCSSSTRASCARAPSRPSPA